MTRQSERGRQAEAPRPPAVVLGPGPTPARRLGSCPTRSISLRWDPKALCKRSTVRVSVHIADLIENRQTHQPHTSLYAVAADRLHIRNAKEPDGACAMLEQLQDRLARSEHPVALELDVPETREALNHALTFSAGRDQTYFDFIALLAVSHQDTYQKKEVLAVIRKNGSSWRCGIELVVFVRDSLTFSPALSLMD